MISSLELTTLYGSRNHARLRRDICNRQFRFLETDLPLMIRYQESSNFMRPLPLSQRRNL
jgi:hypothetical protein